MNKKLKSKLIKYFSEYIRLRNSDNGLVQCFTCGKIGNYKTMDAGHFISCRYNATRFDEKNVQVQCKRCNSTAIWGLKGNPEVFRRRLDEKYGEGTADMLYMKKDNYWKGTDFELNLLITYYKNFVEKRKQLLGII